MSDTRVGALYASDATTFRVWAPKARRVELVLDDRRVAMSAADDGYYTARVAGVEHGARYRYSLDGGEPLPDPASRWQPDGVHAPSAIVDPSFAWTDASWRPPSLRDLVIYELHVGTFSAEGTFDGVIPHLEALRELGVTAIELMPVAAFPGARGWGYDGVFLFAVHEPYGGPEGLRRLVDAAHGAGLGVIIDVVYNHLGPDGNVLDRYGPYFTDRHHTPWGKAVNVDGRGSDEVRAYLTANARMFLDEYHADGLRLDAVHAIVDQSASPFVAELVEAVHGAKPGAVVIAESDLNDPRVITDREHGGLGFDAQWTNDLHHAVHAALTGERNGYYADFDGADDVARALRGGFVYTGQRSRFRGRRHGAPLGTVAPERLVVAAQDHDQVGNRAHGERLVTIAGRDAARLAAAAFLLSPYTPLLFMGEEYGEVAPFLYFTDHQDRGLARAVTEGRRAEFASFAWAGETPDPQDPETFRASRLDHGLAATPGHREQRAFYAECLRLRGELRFHLDARPDATAAGGLVVSMSADGAVCLVLGLERTAGRAQLPAGRWSVLLDSSDPMWGGGGGRSGATVEGAVAVPATTALLLRRTDA